MVKFRTNSGVIVGNSAMTYVPLGKPYGIRYSISNVENSGPGTMTFRMFSDGTLVWTQVVNVTANGTFTKMEPAPKFLATEKNFGPFYLCVTFKTATGAEGLRSPCSVWSWIPIEVPIKSVSHGCVGETGIKFLKKIESGWVDKQIICTQMILTSKASKIKKGEMDTSCQSWATRYYKAVRLVGFNFFDANPAKVGVQTSYVEPNMLLGLPVGVGRDNS